MARDTAETLSISDSAVETGIDDEGSPAPRRGTERPRVWVVPKLFLFYQPNSNPEGFVSLGVAENAVMHKELANFINSILVI